VHNRDGIAIEKTPDAFDEVQLATERELAIRNLDRESHLLRNVRGALRRIGDGSFGVCLHCEEDISPKRLAAIPWAPFSASSARKSPTAATTVAPAPSTSGCSTLPSVDHDDQNLFDLAPRCGRRSGRPAASVFGNSSFPRRSAEWEGRPGAIRAALLRVPRP